MAELVLSRGDIVAATLRKPDALADLRDKFPPTHLLLLKVDVSIPADITAAFAEVKKTFGRLDVVFNNAGYPIISEVEAEQAAEARALFDVNFWGAVNVSTEAVKFFRDVNRPVGGRLLTVSALVGMCGHAGMGYYSAS